MKSDEEIKDGLSLYGWELISRNGLKATVSCRFCKKEKTAAWHHIKEYCSCTDSINTNTYLPIVENEYQCLKCGSTLVLCSACKSETNDKPKCGVCSRKGFPVFQHEDRHLCLHILDRMKMCSPTR